MGSFLDGMAKVAFAIRSKARNHLLLSLFIHIRHELGDFT